MSLYYNKTNIQFFLINKLILQSRISLYKGRIATINYFLINKLILQSRISLYKGRIAAINFFCI
jgi:hypothetical protein